MSRAIRLLLAAGGTGGHLFPGIAVADAARREFAARILFVGTAGGMEKEMIPRLGFTLRLIPAEQLRGKSWWGIIHALWAALLGIGAARRLIKEFSPDVIFSIGGYASAPTVLAGWAQRIPCVLLEPNAIPGLTNRLLGRVATRICVGFADTTRYFPPRKVACTGNPVRWRARPPVPVKIDSTAAFTVLIFGGSAGAHRLNQIVPHAMALVNRERKRLRVIHQTGKADHQEVSATYAGLGIEAEVTPFIDAMHEVYAAADLVVCRAGATTIAELTVLGKAAILVPYPYAADDHQRANAQVLVNAGAARMLLDGELTPDRLSQELQIFLDDSAQLQAMARASAVLGRPDATLAVVRECMRCVPFAHHMEHEELNKPEVRS